MIFPDANSCLPPAYPFQPAELRHALKTDPLFERSRLIELARGLPAESIEYNRADLAIGCDPADMPANGLSVEETIRTIETCRSWVVLMRVEQDPAFRDLMERCLADIAPAAAKTGPMHRKEAFVFISSPGAVTPFHMDPEHNILMQISGSKVMHVYADRDFSLTSPETHEAFHERGHRNIGYREEFEAAATPFPLAPGDAVYVPVKAPHRVTVGEEVSVSFSITDRKSVV